MLQESNCFQKIYIACGKTDLRKGIDGLAELVKHQFQLEPYQKNVLFLFCGTRRDRIRGLLYEGDGYLLLTKRLTDGVYQWPRRSTDAKELSKEEFSRLMHGFTVTSSIRSYQDIGGQSGPPH